MSEAASTPWGTIVAALVAAIGAMTTLIVKLGGKVTEHGASPADTDSGDQRRRLAQGEEEEWRRVTNALTQRMDAHERRVREDLDEVRDLVSAVRGGLRAMQAELEPLVERVGRMAERWSGPRPQ